MANKLNRFWQELRRRKVIRLIVIYAPSAFIVLEATDILSDNFGFPEWIFALVFVILVLGFVALIILSWIFDFTPEGFQRTRPLDNEPEAIKDYALYKHDGSYDGSIAVLPFQDMSPDKDQEYFCDGISEEIINALTRVERLKVIARTSAFAFKGKQMDIREIGNTLNVANVLEGSIRKSNNTVRITAQLIRVEDGSHYWSEAYNRELEDIFSIQEEISMAIVEKLKMNLGGEESGGRPKRHTENPEAYQYYLKGLYYWQMMTPEGNVKAQENYLKAIETDPKYALVYSILGSNFLFAGTLGFIPPKMAVDNAREYTKKALEIDANISVAHSTMGAISLIYDWDLEASKEGFLRSVHLNPNAAWDRYFYSAYLRVVHRFEEAIAESLFVLEKDPFNIYISTYVGVTFLMAGRIDEAIERQKWTINLYPNGFIAHQHLGEALEVKGLLDQAIESYEKAVSLSNGNPMADTMLACALYKAGKTEEAKQIMNKLDQLRKSIYVPSSYYIPYFLLQGDLDLAYHWLEKACEERDLNLPSLMSTPLTDHRLPDDPRFNALLEKTGLDKYRY